MSRMPDDMPDDLPHDMEEYVSYADEIEGKVSKEQSDGEGDGDTDNSGNAGGDTDTSRIGMTVEEIEAEEAAKDSWLEKLKLIFIAPFSEIIPGTVSFTAESDLSKKAFFLRVGLYNRQIEPTDIADPDLIDKLEARHQERRQRFGLGSSVPLEYTAPKPKGPAAPGMAAPGLGATQTAEGGETGSGGGGEGTQVKASATNQSEAAKEKSIFRKSTAEERALMATGATLDEAKAELDEYTTSEEFQQERQQEAAFGAVVPNTENMALHQAFNVNAQQTKASMESIRLNTNLKLTERDGGVESAPSFPIPESR